MSVATSTRFLDRVTPLINERLDTLVPSQTKRCPSSEVVDAARYALLGPGKRLRPALALAVYSMYLPDITPFLDIACALEMIHTYSLIHDDLPGMDNDDMRRGRPTVHKAYSESTAILAGDLLLTHAFTVLASASYPPELLLKIIRETSRYCGGYEGMIAGQTIDMKSEGLQLQEKELENLHSMKTGALIELSVLLGAWAGGASTQEVTTLHQFAKSYGLAFQVQDDLLDVTHPSAKHGKSISSDQTNDKATYVSLLGAERSKKKLEDLLQHCKESLKSLSRDTKPLEELLSLIGAPL